MFKALLWHDCDDVFTPPPSPPLPSSLSPSLPLPPSPLPSSFPLPFPSLFPFPFPPPSSHSSLPLSFPLPLPLPSFPPPPLFPSPPPPPPTSYNEKTQQLVRDQLQARLKSVVTEYFRKKGKNVTVPDKELKKFVDTTICYDSVTVAIEKNTTVLKISAKPNDAIEVEILPRILGRAGHGGIGGGIAGGGAGAGIGALVGVLGGPVGIALGAAIGAGIGAGAGAVAGAGGGAGIAAGVGYALDTVSCTAEDIFPLLATDGFEKQGDGGRVSCTVNLTS